MKLLILLPILALVGCSTGPRYQPEKPQYCYTSQTIVTQNKERVDSLTVVECTDDQVKRLAEPRIGLAATCGEFTYWMRQGGRDVQRKGISCQKPDGTWEIVNIGR
jgi:hypothetical protein